MVLLVRPTNQLPSVREQDYRPGNENGVNAGKAQSVIHLLPKAHTYAYSIELTLGVFTYSPTFKTPIPGTILFTTRHANDMHMHSDANGPLHSTCLLNTRACCRQCLDVAGTGLLDVGKVIGPATPVLDSPSDLEQGI